MYNTIVTHITTSHIETTPSAIIAYPQSEQEYNPPS